MIQFRISDFGLRNNKASDWKAEFGFLIADCGLRIAFLPP